MFPVLFTQQMKALLGPEFPAFEAALQTPPPVSIRWNAARSAALRRPVETPVPWHPDGVYLPERPVFTTDPLFQAGAYYVQEASSMFVYEAVRQHLSLDQPLKALDLCAAPGGKSTLLLSMLSEGSILVSNEVIKPRVSVLRENIEKWGYANVAVCQAEPAILAEQLPAFFDLILVDAPCSGEGMFRKDPDAISEWSPAHVDLCSGRQKRILAEALQCLAPGGLLVYSTCTYNHAENEDNCAWIQEQDDMEYLPLMIPDHWGLETGSFGYHFYPHRVKGEGFFVAVFKKTGGPAPRIAAPQAFRSLKPLPKASMEEAKKWLSNEVDWRFYQTPTGEILAWPAGLDAHFLILDKALKNKWFGVNIGEIKGKDFIPSQALAHSRMVASNVPSVELDAQQALLFLQKEMFVVPENSPKGWALARYQGLGLGWMKILPNRINNYLPAERRIRMR